MTCALNIKSGTLGPLRNDDDGDNVANDGSEELVAVKDDVEIDMNEDTHFEVEDPAYTTVDDDLEPTDEYDEDYLYREIEDDEDNNNETIGLEKSTSENVHDKSSRDDGERRVRSARTVEKLHACFVK